MKLNIMDDGASTRRRAKKNVTKLEEEKILRKCIEKCRERE